MSELPTPHNLEAERAVLGACLINPERVDDVRDVVGPGDFFREAYRHYFTAIVQLRDRGGAIDPLTVIEELRQQGSAFVKDALLDLYALSDGVPRSTNARQYAEIVKEMATRRAIDALGRKLTAEAREGRSSSAELLASAERLLLEIMDRERRGEFRGIADIVERELPILEQLAQRKGLITGIPTGFQDLDEVTRGLQPGNLIIIAARPSMGKSALALNIAAHAAARDYPVAFVSLEMSEQELFHRFVADLSRVNSHRLMAGYYSDADLQRISEAMTRLSAFTLYVNDASTQTLGVLRSQVRRLATRQGIRLLILDYLQLLDSDTRVENRALEVAAFSRGLKRLAKELTIPIIALSQLSRSVEARADKKPVLSDLRESGALEQDADVVLFIYREEVYKPTSDHAGTAEIIVAKQRNGPTASVRLAWLKEFGRFENLAHVWR